MRILEIINRKVEWGGEDVAADRIVEALSVRHDIRRCVFESSDWMKPPRAPAWKQALWMMHNPAALARIRMTHEEFKPACWLIHGIVPNVSFGVYRLAKELCVPILHYAHNFRPFSVNSYLWANGHLETAGLKRNFWPEILAGSWQGSKIKTFWLGTLFWLGHQNGWFSPITRWIAISDFVRDRFIEGGVPPEQISTLRHFHPFSLTFPRGADHGYYLFLGRLSEEKGVKVLLRTWSILRQKLGANTPILRIGGSGPLEISVRDAAEHDPFIEYIGFVTSEKKSLALTHCRALLAPSVWWEGLGLVAYEAYEHAKPIFAAASGGLTETVKDGVTGWLHSPGNAEELAGQIIALESSPEAGEKTGVNGRTWLEENAGVGPWLDSFDRIAASAIQERHKL